jgi:hypothetical protein
MNNLFKVNTIIAICFLITACGQVSQITLTESATPSPTDSPTPIQTTTPTIDIYALPTFSISSPPTFVIPDGTNIPFPTPDLRFPTLLPTIDPKLVSSQLRESISIQSVESLNGHNLQRITGWHYGFHQSECDSYEWLGSNHLLLRPRTGEGMKPAMDSSVRADLSSEPVVINLTNGNLWLRPQSSVSTYEWDCDSIYWSRELGIIINQQQYGTTFGPVKDVVFTYTFDGQQIAEYWGKILGISPSGEKILVDEDTIIDLRKDKVIDLAWHMNYDVGDSPTLYWSSDETRLYRCCFYYADLKTGKSYNLEWEDLQGVDGKPISFTLRSPHIGGQWVRNDTYFFPTWNYMSDTGDPRIIFSPIEKKYYFIELPSASGINTETMSYTFSPDGMYAWITGFNYGDGKTYGFLVNLITLETTTYDISGNDFFWSPDSKFAWIDNFDLGADSGIKLLSVSSGELKSLTVNPVFDTQPWWHPTDNVIAYVSDSKQKLELVNAQTMSTQELELPTNFDNSLVWSPDGDHIALTAEDGSLWQVSYPKLENLEQLTEPMPSMRSVAWSPDGNSIAFVSGTDIYIVDTTK